MEGFAKSLRPYLLFCVFSAITACLYASNFDHEFHMDSTYGLQDNPWIRSLSFIPRYFVDPFTLTALRANGDYRPILQVTYALNHSISGLDMWSWHLTQVMLHALNAVSLSVLTAVLLPRMVSNLSPEHTRWISVFIGGVFLVHPTATGVVNYLWARSSLLTAAFLLPSIISFMTARYRMAAVLFTLALFTKIEAVAALGVFSMWLIMLQAERSDRSRGLAASTLGACNLQNLKILAPFLAVTGLMAVLRVALLPEFLEMSRQDPAMTRLTYFVTQLTAWWHYIRQWWMPVDLIADNLAYPIFSSIIMPKPLAAAYGWGLVAIVVGFVFKVRPVYGFLVISTLALISPHSSFLPLTEMVNEHRPYLPMALLSLCWSVPIAALVIRRSRYLAAGLSVTVLVALALLTVKRNPVFKTWESYWRDTVERAPSWRSHTNMGVHHLKNQDVEQAEAHFNAALSYLPTNSVVLANLGIVQDLKGNHDLAAHFFDLAVQRDAYTGLALESRAGHHLQVGAYQRAVKDLKNALALSHAPFWIHVRFIHAYTGLGEWERALEHTLQARDINPTALERSIVPVIAPFWHSTDQALRGIRFFEGLAEAWPGRWWVHANLESLARRVGDAALADQHSARAAALGGVP